jgi:DNA processing protein
VSSLHLTPSSPSWPVELDTIDAPPDELWLRGRPDLLSHPARVAIVGSRAPTPYGLGCARAFARELAAAGLTVVSGLARGVDQAAHEAVLELGGRTVAVLGCGVDRPWPTGAVTDRVVQEGLLVSELRPGEPPRRHHFPLRNRLISGLCAGVLVIEAAEASGSLITARWAADQGRAVWAVPGRVDHPMARGCHRLIREGATLVEDPAEILGELGHAGRRPAGTPAATPPRDPDLERLLTALTGETLTADELVERCGRELGAVLTGLIELELEGAVVRGPGGLYRVS